VEQQQNQAYKLSDAILDLVIQNIYSLIDYIPNKEEIIKELARRQNPTPDPYELLDVIEFLLKEKKIELNLLELYKNHAHELPFPYRALLNTGLFVVAKYSKALESLTYEQFKNELLKTKYHKFVLRYPEIIRRIYNFLIGAIK